MRNCSTLRFVNYALFILLSFCWYKGKTQSAEPLIPPEEGTIKSRYLFPILPGKPNTLAGTMGELRNTHFHSGLDIRTNNLPGAAVLAAMDGYISRASKSSYGYGNVIYITHPDGNTTLYAHLDSFKGPLESYVRREQYARKTFEIDLKFLPDLFKVKKGDTVALSGNTGGSSGPHLHFDIRDKDMNAINPLKYGFDEIKDKTPPHVQIVALRTMDKNSRINGKFGRFEFRAIKSGNRFRIPDVKAKGIIGIEILAVDKMDLSPFQCGINEYTLKSNDQVIFQQNIDKIEMPITRGIYSLMDNSVLENRGQRFNKLYVSDGNPLKFYSALVDRGLVKVESNPVELELKMKDSYGNTSTLLFRLVPDNPGENVASLDQIKSPANFEIYGNFLLARLSRCTSAPESKLFRGEESINLKPDYHSSLWNVHLIDLSKGLPDSLVGCKQTLRFPLKYRIPSGTKFTFYGPSYTLYFPDSALFDTLYFNATHRKEGIKEVLTVADKTIALLRPADFELRPFGKVTEQHAIYRFEDGQYTYLNGKFENDKFKFQTNKLGHFILLPDQIPPSIQKIYATSGALRFRIRDSLSGIASFEATVNDEWVLMNYDYKTGIIYSEKLDPKKTFKGNLTITVKDRAGNKKIYKQQIL